MSTRNPARMIMVVDDEHPLTDTMRAILERAGYSSTAAYSAAEGLDVLAKIRPDLIISDVMMPVMNGVDFALQASQLQPGVKILLISGHAGTQDLMDAARLEGLSVELLAKPVGPEELLSRVADLLNDVSRV